MNAASLSPSVAHVLGSADIPCLPWHYDSGIESQPQRIERAKQDVTTPRRVVGPIERPPRRLNTDAGHRLRRKRQRAGANHLELGTCRGLMIEEVQAHVRGEPRCTYAETGEPVDVRDSALPGQSPMGAEPGVGVDGARPPVREADIIE